MLFVCLFVVLATMSQAVITTPDPLIFPGQVNIGLMVDLHQSKVGSETICEQINPIAVKKLMAAVWTAQMLNAEKNVKDFTVGIHCYDTCGRNDVTIRQAVRLAGQVSREKNCNRYEKAQIIFGVVNSANSTEAASEILDGFSMPTILTSQQVTSKLDQPTVFSTMPSTEELIEATFQLLDRLEVRQASLVMGQNPTDILSGSHFRQKSNLQIKKKKLKVTELNANELSMSLQENGNKTVILFMSSKEAIQFLKKAENFQDDDTRWVVVSFSSHFPKTEDLLESSTLSRTIWIQPVVKELRSFQKYFERLLKDGRGHQLSFISEYLKFKETSPDEIEGYNDDLEIGRVMHAVTSYVTALQSVSRSKCRNGYSSCLKHLNGMWHREVGKTLRNLKNFDSDIMHFEHHKSKLSFKLADGSLENTEFEFVLYYSGKRTKIGIFSAEKGLQIFEEALLENWSKRQMRVEPYSISRPISNNLLPPSHLDFESNESSSSIHGIHSRVKLISFDRPIKLSEWVQRPSVWVILVLSSLGLLIALYIIVFVAVKLCDRTLTGNQSLGIIQLTAVIGMLLSAILFVVFKPTPTICTYRHLLASISFAVAYAVIIVKLMQLHSLVKIGLGGRINQLNQYLTLFFIVGVQVAMSIQWAVLRPGQIQPGTSDVPQCSTSPVDYIISQTYLLLLSFIGLALAISARHIHRNYNEGHCLLLATGISVPIWIIWMALQLNLEDSHFRDVTVAMFNIVMATNVLAVIFGPKLFTICTQSKVIKLKATSSYAGSVSTLFSNLNDFDTFSLGTTSVKSGSIASRYSEKHHSNGRGSSASNKIPKTLEVSSIYRGSKEDETDITLNPLYEPVATFKTFH